MEEGCLWFYMVLHKAQADPTLTVELQSYKLEVIREVEESGAFVLKGMARQMQIS